MAWSVESVRSNISSNGRRNPYKTITLPKLWLQYTDMIDILRKFIKAERTGHWLQHLEALSEMLLYMIASGHNLYTKSAQLCCIVSCCVPESRGWIPHSKKISDQKWEGLSTDLVVEQVLMRSMKMSGGLTRGRGMTGEHG